MTRQQCPPEPSRRDQISSRGWLLRAPWILGATLVAACSAPSGGDSDAVASAAAHASPEAAPGPSAPAQKTPSPSPSPAETPGTWPARLADHPGLLVPLYIYPADPAWARLATLARTYPGVPMVAIVNPDSGPGVAFNEDYAAGVSALDQAGLVVVGYVSTAYADRSAATVSAEIDRYAAWYPGLSGIFLDEMPAAHGFENYYEAARAHARSAGLPYVIANPGTDPAESYAAAADTLVIAEASVAPDLPALTGSWHAAHDRRQFAILRHGAAFDAAAVQVTARAAGLVYFTDDTLPNPWDTLPTYLDALASALAALDP